MEGDDVDSEDPEQHAANVLGMIEAIDHAIAQLPQRIAGTGTGEQYLDAFTHIFLAARTLYTDYFCVSLGQGRINTSQMHHVEEALQRAHDALSEEEFPTYRSEIRNGIQTILHLPEEIFKIEEEA